MILDLNSTILSSKKIKNKAEVKNVQLTLNIINLTTDRSKIDNTNYWAWNNKDLIYWDSNTLIVYNN